ncbi:MAG TPA: response regulator [Gemmatimonadaceae bacterium]|nr:response regulator [Gemmatimonadaceae bacterium]
MATVLYVDDEDAIRRALRSWLVRRGHVVFTAGSGEEARAVLESQTVDGVFIDIWLGTESGFDLFEWIDMHRPKVAENAVFVTGDIIRDPDVERSLNALERPVLTKPFELGELERIVRGWTAQ